MIPQGYIELRVVLYGPNGLFPEVRRRHIKRTIWRKIGSHSTFRRELVSFDELERANRIAQIEHDIEVLVG